MAYLNLKGEMAKKDISIESISRLLDLHRNSVSKKVNGPSSFTIEEATKIKSVFFPETDLEFLFELSNE